MYSKTSYAGTSCYWALSFFDFEQAFEVSEHLGTSGCVRTLDNPVYKCVHVTIGCLKTLLCPHKSFGVCDEDL